jgi:hypothetical protein
VNTEILNDKAGPITQYEGAVSTATFLVGGLLIILLGYIHFHLWQSVGYRHIPTIGPLFLVQSIAGLVIGLLVMATRRVWAAVLGAGFAAATLGSFLISVSNGLFNFKDSWSAPYAHLAFAVEIVTVVVLVVAVAFCLVGAAPQGAQDIHDGDVDHADAAALPRDSSFKPGPMPASDRWVE